MKIGIVGTGNIGKPLAQKLSAAGHDVKVANSRGPEAIEADVLSTGARAVTAEEAVRDVEVLIISIPLNRIPGFAPVLSGLPDDAVVIDTSNYYPSRDERIDAIEAGAVESVWVVEQIGRPVVKAWNSIGSDSLAKKGLPAASAGRIALPVAADGDAARAVGMALVEDTGFDAFDAGPLAQSWRQQPGAPCYCTDLTTDELPGALAAADAARLPARRDLAVAAITERIGGGGANPDAQFGVRLSRALYT